MTDRYWPVNLRFRKYSLPRTKTTQSEKKNCWRSQRTARVIPTIRSRTLSAKHMEKHFPWAVITIYGESQDTESIHLADGREAYRQCKTDGRAEYRLHGKQDCRNGCLCGMQQRVCRKYRDLRYCQRGQQRCDPRYETGRCEKDSYAD